MAAIRPCKYCGNAVARNAKTCAKCGGKATSLIDDSETLAVVAILVVGAFCFAWLVTRGGNFAKQSSPQPSSRSISSTHSSSSGRIAGAGDLTTLRASVGGEVPVALNEEVHERMVKLAVAKDDIGFAQLMHTGLVWTVPSGTQVRVIDPGFLSYEVRLMSGERTGQSCIVASEYVSRH
jgi:hypothetical protein